MERESISEEQATSWLTPGVRSIGAASLLADLGHEIPTALLPGFLTATLGAPAAALGLIEGVADGLAGSARLFGGALADDPQRRRATAVGGYTTTAILSGIIGAATSVWQVAILRSAAWVARGIRVPPRNALLADAVPPQAYGRAYGFERAMDNLGAIGGPLVALLLVSVLGIRTAILLSIIPGLLATLAIIHAIRHLRTSTGRQRQPIRLQIRGVITGNLRRLFVGVGAFEFGNLAATLLILRATELLAPEYGQDSATRIGIALYVGYNIAAAVASIPAGKLGDAVGMVRILTAGVSLFIVAYAGFAVVAPNVALLAPLFVLAGMGIGCVETAEHASIAALSPDRYRGSAFGLLAGLQSFGNLAASGIAGGLWTLVSPTAAFSYAAVAMLVALVALNRAST